MKHFAFFSPFIACLLFQLNPAFSQQMETGIASYYSDALHGRLTKSEEPYDKNKFTAAHNTLPMGTMIRVTRLDNKKSVEVRVNDRGPHVPGRIVDLSRVAAEKIGLVHDGIARVKLEVIPKKAAAPKPKAAKAPVVVAPKPKKPKTVPASKVTKKPTLEKPRTETVDWYEVMVAKPSAMSGYGVQITSISNYDKLLETIAKIEHQFMDVKTNQPMGKILVSMVKGRSLTPIYRIVIGPFGQKRVAQKWQQEIRKVKGYRDAFVVKLIRD